MNDFMLTTPVVLFTFNRLENTKKVFSGIAQARPRLLYHISDGPRKGVDGEDIAVARVRQYIEDNINWECNVIKDYANVNMGCGRRIASGISKVFENEDRAIFLEDDCVPDMTFFRYCQEMLDRYENNEEIMIISGNNTLSGIYQAEGDYVFSHVPNFWGWAAYKRSWIGYDFELSNWNEVRKMTFWNEIYDRRTRWALYSKLDGLSRHNKGDIWDYQFICLTGQKKGFCIIPRINMVNNIGFSDDSTHTSSLPKWMNMRSEAMAFPIKHMTGISWTDSYDKMYSKYYFRSAWIMRIKNMLGMDVDRSIFEGIQRGIKK